MTSELIGQVAEAISEARTGNSLSWRHYVAEAKAAIAAMQADAEQAAEVEKLTLTVRKLQGHQAALESYLREIRDKPVARSSDAWKRHCLKLQAIAAEALGQYKEARDGS